MKLSIIIAAYNVATYIEKCVYSCVHQNVPSTSYEIVVVNDGSTDATAVILNTLATKIDNLHIIHQENAGLGACRNTGLKNSKGAYVWFVDGDDYLEQHVLQELLDKIIQNKLDVLVLNYATVDENDTSLGSYLNKPIMLEGTVSGGYYYENNHSKSYTWLFVFRKELFVKHKINFKERINMQDAEILPKLLYNCNRLSFLNKVCYYYVQQANSFTNSTHGEKRYQYFKSIIEVRDSLQEFLTTTAKQNPQIARGIEQKIEALHVVVFNHLIFFKYDKKWLKKVLNLLRQHQFYPLKYKGIAKFEVLKVGMNCCPLTTKKVIDVIRK